MRNIDWDRSSPELVGERIRDERKRLGLTLRELSEETTMSISTLSIYESGQRYPTMEFLIRISSLGADIDYIVFGASELGDSKQISQSDALNLVRDLIVETEEQRAILNQSLTRTESAIRKLNSMLTKLEALG